jgi:glycosyltransferase involved in cell wall biosynthesis
MKLLIVIPALNEESSIENVIQRSLEARRHIIASSPVTQVAITIVSDGSTDRTVEIASQYANRVRLIVFQHNKGYGAAIKEGWKNTDAELLGFMDADGTCDPHFFSNRCRVVFDKGADMALGCRLNESAQMPLLRRVGNIMFACLLTVVAHTRVRDTASGMRVLRREAYRALLPLPNGLHFTPAMTARAILRAGQEVKVVEIDMPYFERQGKSKLNVVRDGLRFLNTILEALFLYHPARPFVFAAVGFLAIAVVLMAAPVAHYWRTRTVEEWMLYRFILGHLTATSAFLLFSVALLSRRIVQITFGASTRSGVSEGRLNRALRSHFYWLAPGVLIALGIALVGPNLFERAIAGAAYEHWSRFLSMSFFFLVAIILIAVRTVVYFLDLVAEQFWYLPAEMELERTAQERDVYEVSCPSEALGTKTAPPTGPTQSMSGLP